MVTRTQMAALAPVLPDTVVLETDAYRLQLAPGLSLPLTNGGTPVTSFAPGWRPGLVLTLFQPLLLLEFLHDDGRGAFWLLDGEGRFLGSDIPRLPRRLLDVLHQRARPVLSWLRAMARPGIACTPPEAVTAFLAMHLDVRREIARALCGQDEAVPSDRVLDGPAAPVAEPVDAGRMIVEAGHTPALSPGWRIAGVCTLFAPVIILELVHADGHEGVWYVDRDGYYLGNNARQIAGALKAHLQAWCAVLFAEIWDRVILAPTRSPGADATRFLECSGTVRIDLLNFHLMCDGEPQPSSHRWVLTEPPPPAMSYTVPAANGRVVLDPDHAAAACVHFLRSELFGLVEQGTMGWPSPVDGLRIETPGRALYFNDMCFAYQVHDERHDLTFYVFAMADFFRTFALYFPSADLVVATDDGQMAAADIYTGRARQLLLQHVMTFGMDLVQALGGEPGEIVHAFRGYAAIHVGHFVWQDLSGVSYLVDAFPPERLPRFLVFDDRHHPEIYGPLDEIFPELDGKVVRIDHAFNQHIAEFYRTRTRVIKSTGISVPSSVGRRIVAALRRAPRWQAPVARAAAAHAAGPVVLLGLRIGNRTIDDIAGFASRLVAMLVEQVGAVTIVVDGHNSTGTVSGSTYPSFGDTLSGGSTFMQHEVEIAEALIREFAGTPATIVSNIERPIQESVIWCSEADFFVAPWGAALAKYRWVCNTPGLTTIGRWNLENRNDVAIYHHPGAMEDPTPLLFNAPEAAEDVAGPDAGITALSRSNYRLDEAAVFAQVRALAASHLRPRAVAAPVPGRAQGRPARRRVAAEP